MTDNNKDLLIREQLNQIKILINENQQKFQEIEELKRTIECLEESIDLYNNRLEELETRLKLQENQQFLEKSQLFDKNQRLEDQNKRLMINISDIQEELLTNQKEIQALREENDASNEEIMEKANEYENLKNSYRKDFEQKILELNEKGLEIENFNKVQQELKLQREALEKNIVKLQKELFSFENQNKSLLLELSQLKNKEKQYVYNETENLREEIMQKEVVNQALKEEIERFQGLFLNYNIEISSLESYKHNQTNSYQNDIDNITQTLLLKDQQVNYISKESDELKQEISYKNDKISIIYKEIDVLIEILGTKDFPQDIAFSDEKCSKLALQLQRIIEKKGKYEKMVKILKKKKESYKQKFLTEYRRFSELSTKPSIYNKNERLYTEAHFNPIENEIKDLKDQINYLEEVLSIKKEGF